MIPLETTLVVTAILLALVALYFWGAMVVHCVRNAKLDREGRLLWLAFLVFGKLLGAGVYYFVKVRQPVAS